MLRDPIIRTGSVSTQKISLQGVGRGHLPRDINQSRVMYIAHAIPPAAQTLITPDLRSDLFNS